MAFATSAVGQTRKGITRSAARRDFMTALTEKFKNESTKRNARYAPNRPGNCPGYLTWPVACHQAESTNCCALTRIWNPLCGTHYIGSSAMRKTHTDLWSRDLNVKYSNHSIGGLSSIDARYSLPPFR